MTVKDYLLGLEVENLETHQFIEWGHPVPEIQMPKGWLLFHYVHAEGGESWAWHRPECKRVPFDVHGREV